MNASENVLIEAGGKKDKNPFSFSLDFVTNLLSIFSFQVSLPQVIICVVTCKTLFPKPAEVIKFEDYKVM